MRRDARVRVATLAMMVAGLGAVIAPAIGSAAGGEAPTTVVVSEEVARLNFAVRPKRLPSGLRAPATLELGAEAVEPRAGIPRGLSTITFGLDRSIAFEPRGLPVCSWPAVQHHLQVDAARPGECPRALVGHGEAKIEFSFPETEPFKVPAPVKVYDGGIVGGALELLIEITVPPPAEGTIRLVAPIRQVGRGRVGSEVNIVIPSLSGGWGTLLDLQLELGRSFRQEGRPAAFVTARCRGGKLAAPMTMVLTDGTTLADESIRACRSFAASQRR
jgi:hypothetical protein